MNHRISSSSRNLAQENITTLKTLFPEIVTEGKVDFDMLKTVLGEEVDDRDERYRFEWFGKRAALLGSQKPSKGTLRPDKGASKNFDTTENLYIEGDNLEVLKLLQKSYNSKVKMIYIDPPYNTGKDFVYPDNFKDGIKHYHQLTEQTDDKGMKLSTNTESSGRYHTNWLNMMYPRLKLARNLLTEDGVIFISIDDTEQEKLKYLCNEVFGEKNFVGNLIWENKEGGGSSDSKLFRIKHEYILCYAKAIDDTEIQGVSVSNEDRYKLKDEYINERGPYYLQKLGMGSIQYSASLDYPLECPDDTIIYPKDNNHGKQACWRWSKKKVDWGINNGYIVFQKDSKGIWTAYTKQYLRADNEGNSIKRTQRPLGVIDKFSSTQAAKNLDALGIGNIFDYSKPVELINYLIDRVAHHPNDIIMDFFSGSATTAQAVMELNAKDRGSRKFIMVQLPEEIDDKSGAAKAGYKNIFEIGGERIHRAGEKILEDHPNVTDKLDVGFKALKLEKSNIREWNVDFEELEDQISSFDNMFVPDRTELDIVFEIMLKHGLELALPINIFVADGKNIYDIASGNLIICLDEKIDIKVAQSIIDKRNEYGIETGSVVFADEGFSGNDSEKLNCFKLLQDAGYQDQQLMTI